MMQDEVRMRCIEAITGSGIREVSRVIVDAGRLAEWVSEVSAKPGRPKTGPDDEKTVKRGQG